MKTKIQTITAICAAISSFMFALLSIHFMITRHDLMLIPFVVIGLTGAVIMYFNRK